MSGIKLRRAQGVIGYKNQKARWGRAGLSHYCLGRVSQSENTIQKNAARDIFNIDAPCNVILTQVMTPSPFITRNEKG